MIELAEDDSEFGVVTILQSKEKGTRVYKLGDVFQSEADLSGISTASYIHALYGLIRQSRGKKVLMIGCGGGTLGTMLAHAGYRVAIVDINPASFRFARRYFGLPASAECHVADGLEYLRRTTERYDAIVVDAYQGETVPEHLKSQEFFAALHSAAKSTGAVFANVHILDDRDPDANRLARQLSPLWPEVRILDAPGETNRNAIVAAGAVSKLMPPELEIVPRCDADLVESELKAMKFRDG